MEDIVKQMVEEIIEGYQSDILALSNNDSKILNEKLCTNIGPVIDGL